MLLVSIIITTYPLLNKIIAVDVVSDLSASMTDTSSSNILFFSVMVGGVSVPANLLRTVYIVYGLFHFTAIQLHISTKPTEHSKTTQ